MDNQLKVLQINTCNFGSTGNIMLNISTMAEEHGYISYVAYANSRSNNKKKVENCILIGNILERNLHLKLAYYTGYNGCFSQLGTRKFLSQIDEIRPDIIHLHNLHNCYINLKMLFEYIKEKNTPVIWTLHDCWAFTGQCPHFTIANCEKWKTECYDCPQYKQYPKSRLDKTQKMYRLKKEWFTGVENLTIVTPSQWLADRVSESFLKYYPVKVINNGIDLNLFIPTPSNFRERYGLKDKIVLLGVASGWSKRKGLDIFVELSKMLSKKHTIVLVGLSTKQIKSLPDNIIGLPLIKKPKELAEIYSAADWFINPSMEETMGLVTVEALACGTPAIVSNSTAVPEIINASCGIVTKQCDAKSFYNVIADNSIAYLEEDCIKRAREYDATNTFKKYIGIYNKLIGYL